MSTSVTIKDIAKEAGCSTATVHRALYGKKGLGKETREKILSICAAKGYKTNTSASLLKRKKLNIVVAFPGLTEENKYFYQQIWTGFRAWKAENSGYPLSIEELSYYFDRQNSQAKVLRDALELHQGDIDALITVGHFDAEAKKVVERYKKEGVSIFLVNDDYPLSGRVACVQTDFKMVGEMVGELLSSQLEKGSQILLLTGDPLIPSHYETVQGFVSYMEKNSPSLKIIKLGGYLDETLLSQQMSRILQENQEIKAVFGICARITVLMAEIIEKLGIGEKIRAVGSDVFDESLKLLDTGILKNLVFKNPQMQSYKTANLMFRYLAMGEKPIEDNIYVHSHLVFKSEVHSYQ